MAVLVAAEVVGIPVPSGEGAVLRLKAPSAVDNLMTVPVEAASAQDTAAGGLVRVLADLQATAVVVDIEKLETVAVVWESSGVSCSAFAAEIAAAVGTLAAATLLSVVSVIVLALAAEVEHRTYQASVAPMEILKASLNHLIGRSVLAEEVEDLQ